MSELSPSAPVPTNPSDFETLATLLSADGLIARKLNPAPSRRSLVRRFKAARIPRWKAGGSATRGGGEVYWHRLSVETWLSCCVWTGLEADEPRTP